MSFRVIEEIFIKLNWKNNYCKHVFFVISIYILLSFMVIVPAYAVSEHNSTDADCTTCHTQHQQNTGTVNISKTTSISSTSSSQSNDFQSITTSVIGDIILITSVGQDWYQQGILGMQQPGSQSDWGWTFFDQAPPYNSRYISPSEKITQHNNIYALLLDDGNYSNPIQGATVAANVTYWIYNGADYANHTIQVQLIEDSSHVGFYSGSFNFFGGKEFNGNCAVGCHFTSDTQMGYFPGNYSVDITAIANTKTTRSELSFEVTPWGCEDCHGSKNQHNTKADMDAGCYLCHGTNELTHGPKKDAGNPHQITGHRNIECMECHTNKSLDPDTFDNVTFETGGFNNAPLPQYNNTLIQLNKGTHVNLECTDCHNSLSLYSPQGGYRSDNYTVEYIVNNFTPSFSSLQQYQDYYVVNVTSGEPLNITFDWEGSANLGFYLYPPNFDPNENISLNDGSTIANKPEFVNLNSPLTGDWILAVIGYDLDYTGNWMGTLQSPINYTINSTYPLQQKNLPRIPECNNCHNSTASDGAYTEYVIPDWNPGFAHVDINNDGTFDLQCRMCHNAMHNIIVRDCQNCHLAAPPFHPIQEPQFSENTSSECLVCHGDPHEVAGSCVSCHEAISPTNLTLNLGLHSTLSGTSEIEDGDCETCHFASFPMIPGAANSSNTHYCENCHTDAGTGPNKSTILFEENKHGRTLCVDCHVADGTYHQENPRGSVANTLYVNRYNPGDLNVTDCVDCHYSSNLDDAPFHAPGAGSHVTVFTISECKSCHDGESTIIGTIHSLSVENRNDINPAVTTPVLSSDIVTKGTSVTITATASVGGVYNLVDGAQVRIENATGEVIPWTPMYADDGDFEGTSEAVNITINTSTMLGDYTVLVRAMGGGKAQSNLYKYYPMNGDVSVPLSTTLTVEQPKGYINGTVTNGTSPVSDAVVYTTGASTTTDSNGNYSLKLLAGTYNV
ncbi:MAG: hypothetical protein E4G94_04010, partial [ANME-2 cluster archaeon]